MDQGERPGTAAAEDELHAFVDGELPPDRRQALAARLAACPEAAGRTEALLSQRAALTALGRLPLERRAGGGLARLESELCRALRRQGKVRRAVAVATAVVVLAGAGTWVGRLTLGGARGTAAGA